MKELNVLYTVDRNYLKYMITSMYSLLENNEDTYVNVHIIADNFDFDDYLLIDKVANLFPNANVNFYSFSKIENKIDWYDIPNWRGSKMSNARVFFSTVIKDVPNLLYLDSDTFVVGSLKDIDKHDGSINMVKDVMPNNVIKELGVPINKYYNSGVMYINMDKWYKNDCDKKIADTLDSKVINFRYPDQDIINASLRDDIKEMSPEYNLFTTDYYYSMPFLKLYNKNTNIVERYSDEEIKKARKNPIVLHGTPLSFIKDYTIEKRLHPYNKYYTKYNKEIFGDSKKGEFDFIEKMYMDLGLHAKVLFPKEVRTKVRKLVRKD